MGLSYTTQPFNPTTVYPNQVTIELDAANQNFATLAQIFVNNDPTTLQLQPQVGGNGYANPVNLSAQSSDYMLQPGQVGVVSFNNAVSVPLNIATTNGTFYEMYMACANMNGNANGVFLNPNNTSYNNAFTYFGLWIGTMSGSGLGCWVQYNAFRIAFGTANATVFLSNFTGFKSMRQIDIDAGGGSINMVSSAQVWNDTTTSWTSLGTVTFPQQTTGFILVRRLV